jgi:hypothetical protein
VLTFFGLCSIVSYQQSSIAKHELAINPALTWDKWLHDCSMGEANIRASHNFDEAWKGQVIQWQGRVVRVNAFDEAKENDDDTIWIGDTQHNKYTVKDVQVLISMSTTKDFDVLLGFDEKHFEKNLKTIDAMHTG